MRARELRAGGAAARRRARHWRASAQIAPLVFLAALLGATDAPASPFASRDQNPFLAGFGIPSPLPAMLPSASDWSSAIDLNWSSTALTQSGFGEALIVDAETRELRATLGRALSDRFAIQLQIPYRYTGAGTLDGFIDGWHDFFDLPEGARPALARDQIRIAYEHRGALLVDVDSSASGLGDVSLDLGYRLMSTASSAASAWLTLKMPTGDSEKLTGSGAADASLVIAGEHRFHDRWTTYAQAGVARLGTGDLLPALQRRTLWSALAGIGWHAWRGLELKVQIDAHTAAYDDTRLDFLCDAFVLTVGGAYRFRSGWQVELAVSEDAAVETAPDVVFMFGVKRGARL